MENIILLDPALKSVKHLFQQQHPYSLWLATGLTACLTHVLAQRGFRPVCAVVLITLALHLFNCFESKNKADASTTKVEMCELTRLIIRYYHLACDTHKWLNTVKSNNTIMYWLLIFAACLVPIILYVKISAFCESYSTMIIWLLILQYKLNLQWTATSPSADEICVPQQNNIDKRTAESPAVQDNNLETFSLVWLDASINNSPENLDAQQRLRTSINHLKTFKESQECEQYIRSVPKDDRIVFIVSNRADQEFVHRIHQLRQISSIFVYCTDKKGNEQWAKQFKKVKGVIDQLDQLVTRIRSDQEKQSHNKVDESLPISIFKSSAGHGQSTTEINGQFLYSQLLIDCLLRMKSSSTDRNELISLSQEEYKGNKVELDILHEFQQNYSPNRSLWWYTRDSFLYRLLNKALRVQNIDLLFLFRFFIRDIRQQLEQHKCSSQIRVFRGQLMSNEELQVLKASKGELISINSFLSTSGDRDVALFFLNTSNDLARVLFEIDADFRLDSVKPFANITSHSYFPNEDEVLFMLGSIFRLVDIHLGPGGIWIIQMSLCSDNDHDLKPILDYMKNELAGGGETSLLSFGIVLRKMGKFVEAERYYGRLLKELPHDDPDIANCYHALGIVAREKGDYDSSLQWHQKSLAIKMRTLKADDPGLAHSHNSIGNVYDTKGDYKRALESYFEALAIWKQAFGDDDPKIAMCFNNIGGIYQEEKRYSEALEYHQKALAIRQKCLPVDHPDLSDSHNNIASVHGCLGQYDLALEHLNRSLEISKKSLPPQHPDIAMTLENMGSIYENKGELKEARSYFEKAATIYRGALPATHPKVVKIEDLIQRVLSKLK